MSVLFKLFTKIDVRIAKKFNVLATLVDKLKAESFKKGDIIIQPTDSIDKIYIVYSGQVEQTHTRIQKESELLMAEDVLALWYLKERKHPQACAIKAKVKTPEA